MSACRRHYPGRFDGACSLSAAPPTSAFPTLQLGRLLHYIFRGLLSVHSRYNLQTRRVALCDPLHRRLRRLCCLHRRSDCFYEKVIKVKADVAALLRDCSALVGSQTPPLAFPIIIFFISVTEHQGSASNQVPRETLVDATHRCRASIRTLNGPFWTRCKLGFDPKPRVHHHRDEPGIVGCCHLPGGLT